MYNVIYDFAEKKPVNPILAQIPVDQVGDTPTDEQGECSVKRNSEDLQLECNGGMPEELFKELEDIDEIV